MKKAKSRSLEAQLIAARKNARVAREQYEKTLARYEASSFDAFLASWTGKWFKYDMGTHMGSLYGYVLGEADEPRKISVMDIQIWDEYEWLTLHENEWDMSRFEMLSATILDKDRVRVLKERIRELTENNFLQLGMDLYDQT